MVSNSDGHLAIIGRNAFRRWTKYALPESRLHLLECYNTIAGPPGASVVRVQEDFIKGRMEPKELLDFVITCEWLISSARRQF